VDNVRAAAVVQTMKRAFPMIETFAVKGPWKSNQTKAENLIFFGGSPVDRTQHDVFMAKVTEMALHRQLPTEAIALLSTHRDRPWPQGLELSDDFAPYDVLIGKEVSAIQ
jgi:hypothetical protein